MQREIEKNINLLKSRIEQASQNSEKNISKIGIIAVSKKKSLRWRKFGTSAWRRMSTLCTRALQSCLETPETRVRTIML